MRIEVAYNSFGHMSYRCNGLIYPFPDTRIYADHIKLITSKQAASHPDYGTALHPHGFKPFLIINTKGE